MNSRTISTPSIPQAGRAYAGVWLLRAAALLAFLVISIVALWQGFAPGETVVPITAPLSAERFLAQNPELSVVSRYAAAQDETSFLARNPELIIAARYVTANTRVDEGASFLHRNPELSAAARYSASYEAATSAVQEEAALLAHNPELSVAARYSVLQDEASFLARNPELSVARRYALQQAGD